MAKSRKSGAAPVNKQTTEPSAPAPAAPTTNPENNPTVVPPVTDKNVADPNVDDTEITETTDDTVTPPVEGAAAQAPVNDDETTQPADDEVEKVEVKEGMKRKELDAIAVEEGLTNASKYKDKAAVVAAVERVRAGEAAADVDQEVTPVVPDAGAGTEVEAVNPFYDLEGKVTRKVGDKFKVTETRAAELRGHKLIK